MEAESTSETSASCYQTTRRYNPEDSHLHTRKTWNLTSKISSYTCLDPTQLFPCACVAAGSITHTVTANSIGHKSHESHAADTPCPAEGSSKNRSASGSKGRNFRTSLPQTKPQSSSSVPADEPPYPLYLQHTEWGRRGRSHVMKPEGSLPCSQQPATLTPYLPSILILSSHLYLSLTFLFSD
jgi:hypothetical protein